MKHLKIVDQELRNVLKRAHTLGSKILQPVAEEIEAEANRIVPVKTGALRDSIHVRVSYGPRYPGLIATASATNPRTGYDYAVIQHENPDYHHDAPGQYHYISEPFDKAVEEVMDKI